MATKVKLRQRAISGNRQSLYLDFANESNKFNQLLKAKGDKGIFVAGNYVPFKENENEYTTTEAKAHAETYPQLSSHLP